MRGADWSGSENTHRQGSKSASLFDGGAGAYTKLAVTVSPVSHTAAGDSHMPASTPRVIPEKSYVFRSISRLVYTLLRALN